MVAGSARLGNKPDLVEAAVSGARETFHLRWGTIRPPLRPGPEVAAAMRPWFAGRDGLALQFGVTPEIARLAARGVAVDWNEAMVRLAWEDGDGHRAIVGDWLGLPLRQGCVDIAFGDAPMSMLDWPGPYHGFLANVARVLRPGGRMVLRCFVGPDEAETVAAVAAAALAGEIAAFSAFKLRFNMAAFAAEAGSNDGARIHRMFQRQVPDRERLCRATGWARAEVDSMDAYEGGLSLHSYPTRAEIAGVLPAGWRWRFVESGDYALVERCPLLVVDVPG